MTLVEHQQKTDFHTLKINEIKRLKKIIIERTKFIAEIVDKKRNCYSNLELEFDKIRKAWDVLKKLDSMPYWSTDGLSDIEYVDEY